MQLTFLSAATALRKTFTLDAQGTIHKDSYPGAYLFTSHPVEIHSLPGLFKAIQTHSEQGHCILKGIPHQTISNASRAGLTSTDSPTEWMCLDLDRHQESIDETLRILGLDDVSYVLQYSASQGLPDTEGTVSAHLFFMLDAKVPAPMLKTWLKWINLKHFREHLDLNTLKNCIRWPIDVTVCQNDKLIYIGAPRFNHMKDPCKEARIQLVKREHERLPISRLGAPHSDAVRKEERAAVNQLRAADGLDPVRTKMATEGEYDILKATDGAVVTGITEGEQYTRLNLNGGDSWAYWHFNHDFEWLYDWKSMTKVKLKDLLPGYYDELKREQNELAALPTEDGDIILAFCELRSAQYYRGTFNPTANELNLYQARDRVQLEHWLIEHQRPIPEFWPNWTLGFDPTTEVIFDNEAHFINTFRPTEYMHLTPDATAQFPAIQKAIEHMLNAKRGSPVYEAFINWFAVIFQRKAKPHTAWVAHGIEGTGKGFFANRIARTLLGPTHFTAKLPKELEDQFNGWLEPNLFVFIDECDVDDFREKGRITATLRNYITEPMMSIRKMRQQAVDVPNHASFFFSSNRPQPVHIPPTDRRYNLGNFQPAKLPRPDDKIINEELSAFAAYLLAHDACVSEANMIVHTADRDRVQTLSMTSTQLVAHAIKTGDLEMLMDNMPDERLLGESSIVDRHTQYAQAYITLMKRLEKEKPAVLTRDELYIIFEYCVGKMPASPNKFTTLLRHNGLETARLRRNSERFYGVEVKWKTPEEE